MRLYVLLIGAAVIIAFCDGFLFLSLDETSFAAAVTTAAVQRIKDDFKARHSPLSLLELEELYPATVGQRLMDPEYALPRTLDYPLTELQAIYAFARSCKPDPAKASTSADRPEMRKAWAWHLFLCGQSARLPARFFESPPYLHPSGSSYVYFAVYSGAPVFADTGALQDDLKYVHVSELRSLSDRIALKPPFSILADMDLFNQRALAAGLDFLISDGFVLMRKPSSLEAPVRASYLVYPRKDWNAFLGRHAVLASEFKGEGSCHLRDGAVCWNYSTDRLHYFLNKSQLLIFIELTFFIAVLVGFLYRKIREQRQEEERRRFALQTLAHEVRTPLATLTIALEVLRNDFDLFRADVQKAFFRACDAALRLQRVVEASRQYLTSQSGGQFITLSPRDIASLNDLVLGILEPFEGKVVFEGLTTDRGYHCDPYWLMTCLKNLVENALKHGQPPVRVVLREEGDRLLLSVSDQGRIDSMSLREMTEAFVKGRASDGLGLGLSIVKNIVREMNGKLEFSSSPTTFTIKLRI